MPEKEGEDRVMGLSEKILFPEYPFELISGKSTKDEDDEEDKNLNEKAGRAELAEVKTLASMHNILCSEHGDNSQDKTHNYPGFQEAVIIFLSLVKKAKHNTKDQIQQFKPHTDALRLGNIAPTLQIRFPERIRPDLRGFFCITGT